MQQGATQLYVAENVVVTNGSLVIRTQYNPTVFSGGNYQCARAPRTSLARAPRGSRAPSVARLTADTSGWVESKESFNYSWGRFEARIQVPKLINGVWPFASLQDMSRCSPLGGQLVAFSSKGGSDNNQLVPQ